MNTDHTPSVMPTRTLVPARACTGQTLPSSKAHLTYVSRLVNHYKKAVAN